MTKQSVLIAGLALALTIGACAPKMTRAAVTPPVAAVAAAVDRLLRRSGWKRRHRKAAEAPGSSGASGAGASGAGGTAGDDGGVR